MKTSSAKNKGRKLQQYVAAKILQYFPELKPKDAVSRSMGSGGDDVMLSPRATEMLPVSIECKSRKNIAVYDYYAQARLNADGFEPIVVIKQNNEKPLVIIDLDIFMALSKAAYMQRKING